MCGVCVCVFGGYVMNVDVRVGLEKVGFLLPCGFWESALREQPPLLAEWSLQASSGGFHHYRCNYLHRQIFNEVVFLLKSFLL